MWNKGTEWIEQFKTVIQIYKHNSLHDGNLNQLQQLVTVAYNMFVCIHKIVHLKVKDHTCKKHANYNEVNIT